DRVRREQLACGLARRRVVTRVHLGQRLALVDRVAALLATDDADRRVDRILLRPASGAEMKRGEADGERLELRDVTAARSRDLTHDAGRRQRCLVWVPALGPDPALVGLDGGPVRDDSLDEPAGLGCVDAEVRE